MILNPMALPAYMRGSRYFRIEYIDPLTGHSNTEGSIYLPDVPDIYEVLDKIEGLIQDAYKQVSEKSAEEQKTKETCPLT
jgi:hypothetical protein